MACDVTRLNVGASPIAKKWQETPVHGTQYYRSADYIQRIKIIQMSTVTTYRVAGHYKTRV